VQRSAAIGSAAGLNSSSAQDVLHREIRRETGEVVGEGSAPIGHADGAADDQSDSHGDHCPDGDDHDSEHVYFLLAQGSCQLSVCGTNAAKASVGQLGDHAGIVRVPSCGCHSCDGMMVE
jgi:hypothetical protein